jgi:predicted nuclease of predicted toxin-antitoxin system
VATVKYLLHADLPAALYRGLKRRRRDLDVIRVHHDGLSAAGDPDVMSFAAESDRILVTRDKATMRDFTAARVQACEKMPGLLVVRPRFCTRQGGGIGLVIEELLLIAEYTDAEEWDGLIQFIPFLLE